MNLIRRIFLFIPKSDLKINKFKISVVYFCADILSLFVVLVRSDSAFGAGLLDDFCREISGQRIIVRKLHMIRTASLRDGI